MNWHSCYDQSWKGMITNASFVHPAKMSRTLLTRIITHGLARGYWREGDLIGDCFGGIGTTGIIGAYHGLKVICCELEGKFVSLARRNFALHQSKWKTLGLPRPVIVQGDSRKFDEIVGEFDGIISSPPYNKPFSQDHNGTRGGQRAHGTAPSSVKGSFTLYGTSKGQIEGLKSGSLDAVLGSPPFATAGVLDHKGQTDKMVKTFQGGGTKFLSADYGQTPGQIGRLKEGKLDGVIASPPYEEGLGHGGGISFLPHDTQGTGQKMVDGYPSSAGQIGREKSESYWEAVSLVYQACWRELKPQGVICLVVKDYVKDRKIIPLCDQTCRLLDHLGFVQLERIRAMLTKQTVHADLFAGTMTKTTSRKSFFRRLAEKNGSPSIDFEEVLVWRKP